MANIENTTGANGPATNFSALKPMILCNILGEALNSDGSSSGIVIENTRGALGPATNFSALKPIVLVDINGNSIN